MWDFLKETRFFNLKSVSKKTFALFNANVFYFYIYMIFLSLSLA